MQLPKGCLRNLQNQHFTRCFPFLMEKTNIAKLNTVGGWINKTRSSLDGCTHYMICSAGLLSRQ